MSRERAGRRAPAARAGLVLALLLACVRVDAEEQIFAAPETGLDFQHANGATGQLYIAEMMGAGGALFDMDGDGDLDLYLPQGGILEPGKTWEDTREPPRHPLPLTDRLYRNDLPSGQGGGSLRFVDVTEAAELTATHYGMGVASGDFDNDGRVDLYVANLGPNQLLRNLGGGRFADATAERGAGDPRWSVGAAAFDYDRDGWLDLYVVNYLDFTVTKHHFCPNPTGSADYCGPLAYPPVADRLLRNRGDGSFEDVSRKAGIDREPGTGLGAVAADFDGDGWLDLYVTNDQMANHLFLNRRDGTFADEALLAGCAVNEEGLEQSSMGVDAGDLDGDSYPDLFMTHFKNDSNTAYRNDGRGMFRDISQQSGLANPSWPYTGFGTGFFDFDGDGHLDLLVTNGAVSLLSNKEIGGLAQRDQLFRGTGDGRFTEATAEAGEAFRRLGVGRGAAFGDVDNDGDTDVLVTQNGGPARLLLNRIGSEKSWLGLELRQPAGEGATRDALGARLALRREGRPTLWRRVRTDGSYASAHDPRVLFGLGEHMGAVTVEVHWLGGPAETFPGLAPGRYHTLVRGQGQGLPGPETEASASPERPEP